jgi:1,4-dihydroxy-2-naphthoate octaprenyltransferase
VKFYSQSHTSQIDLFKSSVSCVALTSNIWFRNAREDYIHVVTQYVTVD